MNYNNKTISVIGLGYVGLPLAIEFGKKYNTIGFDINPDRVKDLNNLIDNTNEVSSEDFKNSKYINFTTSKNDLQKADIHIITVPTPVDSMNQPDLSPIKSATETVAKIIKEGDVIVYESTVYPGVTEEFCVPIIEDISGFELNKSFYVGYSPERINPGDMERRLVDITKVVSGSNDEVSGMLNDLYSSIIHAGTFLAESIKVAEAAKVIENTQRDVNIGLINELSKIFSRMDIDTSAVLEAAGTKWNFLNFEPGLVGGHCIGVDPFYIAYKAKQLNYDPEIILSARKTNDSMAKHACELLINRLLENNLDIKNCKILILGATFKENCPDFRNSKVIDLYKYISNHASVQISDEHIDAEIFLSQHSIVIDNDINHKYDAVILAVPHDYLLNKESVFFKSLLKVDGIFFDLKAKFAINESDIRL